MASGVTSKNSLRNNVINLDKTGRVFFPCSVICCVGSSSVSVISHRGAGSDILTDRSFPSHCKVHSSVFIMMPFHHSMTHASLWNIDNKLRSFNDDKHRCQVYVELHIRPEQKIYRYWYYQWWAQTFTAWPTYVVKQNVDMSMIK